MRLKPWCCFVGCLREAAFRILTINGGPDPYSDEKHACEEHVGALLGHQPEAKKPKEVYWRVLQISED